MEDSAQLLDLTGKTALVTGASHGPRRHVCLSAQRRVRPTCAAGAQCGYAPGGQARHLPLLNRTDRGRTHRKRGSPTKFLRVLTSIPRRGMREGRICTFCDRLGASPREISTGIGADALTVTVLGFRRA
jgi:hypothetical protein